MKYSPDTMLLIVSNPGVYYLTTLSHSHNSINLCHNYLCVCVCAVCVHVLLILVIG